MAEVGDEGRAMTPVLMGRWQTRTFVLWTIGLLVTFLAPLAYDGPNDVFYQARLHLAVRAGLDAYILIQQLKWDRDWPPFAQWLAAAWEGLFLALVISYVGLPLIDDVIEDNFGEILFTAT